MKTTLLSFIILLSTLCSAQVAHVFSVNNKNYTITFSKNDKIYNFDLKDSEKDSVINFTLPKLDIVTFKNVMYRKLKVLDTTLTDAKKNDKAIDTTAEETVDETIDTTVDETVDKKIDKTVDETVDEPVNLKVDKTVDEKIEKTIEEIFYTVVANIDIIDDLNYAPLAGTLKIAEYVNVYRDKDNESSLLKGIKFKIENVQIVFQQGYIQDIIVDGIIEKSATPLTDSNMAVEEFEGAEIRFTNYYGIGFSSKRNFRKLDLIDLYPNKKKDIDKKFSYTKQYDKDTLIGQKDAAFNRHGKPLLKEKVKTTTVANLFELNELHIKMGEVIQAYDFKNDLYTTDYSPANVKVAIEGGKSTTLYKDKTYKILEARIFSDFLGFNSDKPNGLVQVELEKQFNFNTTRYKFITYHLRTGFGFMEYLKLSGGITKIEDNNRFLIPDMEDVPATSYTGNQILINKRYTTPVDVVNHQTSNIGVSSNIVFLDMPSIKSQLHINGGFKFAQTKVQDSLRTFNADMTINSKVKEYNLPYWQLYPELIWHILPETRYGFYCTYRPKYFYSISGDIAFKGMRDQLTGIRRDNISNWINEFELLGYLYVNEEKQNGKLFIRWRLNSEMGYSKNNFSQFQVGYSFYILGRGRQNKGS